MGLPAGPLPPVPRPAVAPPGARAASAGPRGGWAAPLVTPRRPKLPPGMVRITVLTPRTGQVELEVPRGETGTGLRQRLAAMGEVRGNPADFFPLATAGAEAPARLLFHGVPLDLDRPLGELGA